MIDIFKRHRLSLRNTRDNREVWYTYISPSKIFTTAVITIVITFAVVITIVSYSPLLENLPGYRSEALRSREEVISNIIRLDSMERVISEMMIYSENISQIMSGKTIDAKRDLKVTENKSREQIRPNAADSALRREMEGAGRLNIRMAEVLAGAPIIKPINGVVTRHFDINEEHFGVEITAAAGEKILALQDGVVALSSWSPDGGYIVSILHHDNLVSIYNKLSEVVVKRGEVVRGGKVIGYNSEERIGENNSREIICSPIIFEVWSGGNPIDPERFITF